MSGKKNSEQKKRKLQTAWREEAICPYCHDSISMIEVHEGDLEGVTECPSCEKPISIRERTRTEYLVLS